MAQTQGFTEKAQQAILEAQRDTRERRLAQLEPETLLRALVSQADGVVPQVLIKTGIDPATVARGLNAVIDQQPKLQYDADARPSTATQKALGGAEKAAQQFGDEYISTEHLLLGILDGNSAAARLLTGAGATGDAVKSALKEIRGGQRVT